MDIKHFDKYWERLENFAAAFGIKVITEEDPGDGSWISSRNLIRIDPDLEESDALAVFIHELGHAMDEILLNSPSNKIEEAYGARALNQERLEDTMLILEHEVNAWKYGRAIAKRLKIRLGRWFSEYQSEALKSHQGVKDNTVQD